MTDPLTIEPLGGPIDATVTVPGSKSLTNRALVCAALAEGTSVLRGALLADDTEAMLDSLGRLGVQATIDPDGPTIGIVGTGGRLAEGPVTVDARQSGTTARFLLPVLGLGAGAHRLDGSEQLRARPMAPGFAALRALGVAVVEEGEPGRLPVTVNGDGRVGGGRLAVAGDVSSQFLSGLLLAAPYFEAGLVAEVATTVVSRPFVAMTTSVMESFGAAVSGLAVVPGRYRGTDYLVEPDATAASYLFAAAVICGGRVRVPGLGGGSAQGDLAFVDVLERMGAAVERGPSGVTVTGTGTLHGIDVDLGDLSDTAQTLAAVAVFGDGPTRVTGIGFIRRKETDRVGAVVRELRRCGIHAVEEPDGFVVHPGRPVPAVIETYDDHRMAMSFALLGLRVPGLAIAGPGCVAKTFPGYWDTLADLRRSHR